ncbi:MAG: response regulator, partial [Firmicutes bacterium]|nr:response regulator [Bacillota bacterium]
MFKMLVIDDEYLVRLGIRQAIPWEQHGIVVVGEAANGQQGLELALQHAPDVILCDVRMPVMDGIAFVRRVQELGLDCAVVILSGYKEFDYVKGTLEGGAFAYLLKPIDDDELIETVRRALQQLEQRRQATRREQHWQQVLPSVAQSLLLKLIAGDA